MHTRYVVKLSAVAEQAIMTHAKYITHDAMAPENAVRWLDAILRTADTLEKMPRRMPFAPEARPGEDVRCCVVMDFLLIYEINDETRTVESVSARHGHQLPEKRKSRSRPQSPRKRT